MLKIGPVPLKTNLLLAPIAGYCDLAFRTVCREWGGVGLACTDLLSPQGLLRGTATSLDLAKTNEFDKPVGMQLYGSDPEIMAQGARWAVEHGATVIDINMGCPVDKVTKKDGGSALLTNLEKAVAIAARVVKELEKCPLDREEWERRVGYPLSPRGAISERNSTAALKAVGPGVIRSFDTPISSPHAERGGTRFVVPLTCKMRLCWHDADYHAGAACSPHLARMLADVGVVAVTVHGRTTEMKFSGHVQLAGIARVVEAVNGQIPIIGNGDVKEPADAERMIRETGCSGVMIGRGALAAPWIFRQVWEHLCDVGLAEQRSYERAHASTPPEPVPPTSEKWEPTLHEKLATVRRYFDLMRQYRDERYALWQIQRRISWFAKKMQARLPDGRMESIKPFREAVRVSKGPEEIYAALELFGRGGLRGGVEEQVEEGA
ncbi:MAG: tRNA-dihydrouridine synthase family protein [Phycisphaerales bacterium]